MQGKVLPLTEEQATKLKELVAKGLSYRELGIELGLSKGVLERQLKQLNLRTAKSTLPIKQQIGIDRRFNSKQSTLPPLASEFIGQPSIVKVL